LQIKKNSFLELDLKNIKKITNKNLELIDWFNECEDNKLACTNHISWSKLKNENKIFYENINSFLLDNSNKVNNEMFLKNAYKIEKSINNIFIYFDDILELC
jgi:hypothetical protein